MFYGIPRIVLIGAVVGFVVALFVYFKIIEKKMTKRSRNDKLMAVALWALMLSLAGAIIGFGTLKVLENTVYDTIEPQVLQLLPLHFPDQTVRERDGDFYVYKGLNPVTGKYVPLQAEVRSSETSGPTDNLNKVVVFPKFTPTWVVWLGAPETKWSSFHQVFLIKKEDRGD